jgi:hypothetical protein
MKIRNSMAARPAMVSLSRPMLVPPMAACRTSPFATLSMASEKPQSSNGSIWW